MSDKKNAKYILLSKYNQEYIMRTVSHIIQVPASPKIKRRVSANKFSKGRSKNYVSVQLNNWAGAVIQTFSVRLK